MKTRYWHLPLAVAALFTVIGASAGPRALGQSTARWQVPEPLLRVDLGPDNRYRQVALASEGLAIEVPLRLFMIGRAQIAVEVALPEPGRFDLVLTGKKALVELRNVRREGKVGRADIISQVPPLSVDNAAEQTRGKIEQIQQPARQKAREKANGLRAQEVRKYIAAHGEKPGGDENHQRDVYAQIVADEQTADQFKSMIGEFLEQRPKWLRRDIEERLTQPTANPRKIYHELTAVRLADEYLERFGFQSEQRQVHYAEYVERLQARLTAVYEVVSGNAAKSERLAVDTGEMARLREALLVELRVRLYTEPDARDPNSQWFNAQRVVCRAAGIMSITVTGQLDPPRHDHADCWILEKYSDAVSIEAPDNPGYRVEGPLAAGDRAVVRIVATGEKPLDYSFVIKVPGKSRGAELSIYETLERADNKFPF